MKKVAIIGFGRFGELLAQLCAEKFDVVIIENNAEKVAAAKQLGYTVKPFESISDCELIFLAVPISGLEETLRKLAPLVNANHVVIDLCSVKVYPVELMKRHLKNAQIIATHPMFGPDSAKKGLAGLRVALCPIRADEENIQLVSEFWQSHGTIVTETTPEAHDQDTAYSQAFTYSIAHMILNMNLPEITFTTRSYNDITEVARLSANDTPQLFHDMLFYNPYFSRMKAELAASIAETMARLNEIEAEQKQSKLV